MITKKHSATPISITYDSDLWPHVSVDDDGIRKAGPDDACLYCRSKIGEKHKANCVIVTRTVKVRYSYEIEIQVPHSWSADDIEFHRNESSWCSANSISELNDYIAKLKNKSGQLNDCMCEQFYCEYVGEL